MGFEQCVQCGQDQLLLEVCPKQWPVDKRVAWEEIGQDKNVSIGHDECHRYQKDLLAVHSNGKETTVLWEGGVRIGPLVFLQQKGVDDGRGVCQCTGGA